MEGRAEKKNVLKGSAGCSAGFPTSVRVFGESGPKHHSRTLHHQNLGAVRFFLSVFLLRRLLSVRFNWAHRNYSIA